MGHGDEPADRPASDGPTRWITLVIALVGVGFALYALLAARDELTSAEVRVPSLIGAVVVALAGMFVVGTNWMRIMRWLGEDVPGVAGMRWYYVGQLGKYIPGGLWAVVGRGEFAVRGGVARRVAYASVAMSLITTYAAAAATGALFLAFDGTGITEVALWTAASAAMIVVTVVGLSEAVVGRVNRVLARFGLSRSLPSAPIRLSVTAVVLTMPAWALIGSATALAGAALGIEVDLFDVLSATAYAWLAGFLVIPLPGGLGIREAVFIALWNGSTAEAAAIAIVARLVFVAVDLIGAGVSTVFDRMVRRRISGSR